MLRFVPLRRFVPRSAYSAACRVPVRVPVLRTVLVVSALGLAGCQSLTSVDAPDVVQPGDYATAAGATALAVGAITQFHDAFGRSSGQVLLSGAIADELFATTTSSDAGEGAWDSRNAKDPSPSGEPYSRLQGARQRLLSAIGSFQRVAPDSSARIGQLFALLGYTSVFFGENFCAGIPLSHRDRDLRPVYGQPLTTAQIFDSALTAFDSALFYGADSARIVDLARVGRGRALLNQGRFAEAAQAVASVPTTYIYHITYLAEPGFNNGFVHPDFGGSGSNPNVTVPEQEGINGLNWRSAADPRVVLVNHSPPLVGTDSLVVFGLYQAMDAPIPLAGGLEARLIEAEAALQAGDAPSWLAIHNTLRATVGLGALPDPGSPQARVDLHFRERALWLFLTGHRHGDLRRLVRQYGRGAETVFPTGAWREGIAYGAATSMALPATEAPNPHYTGCLSREA